VSKRLALSAAKEVEQRRKDFEIRSCIAGIEYQFAQFVAARKTAEDRKRAIRLEKSAARYLSDLFEVEPFWSFMSFKAPEKTLGLEQPPVKYFGRDAWFPEHCDAVLYAELVRIGAKATADALKQGKRHPDMNRRALGQGLASTFFELKGQPTHANESTFETPMTEFSRFVRLAILASPHADHPRVMQIKTSFASFVRDAANNFAGRR
jgi:hypothetical protein